MWTINRYIHSICFLYLCFFSVGKGHTAGRWFSTGTPVWKSFRISVKLNFDSIILAHQAMWAFVFTWRPSSINLYFYILIFLITDQLNEPNLVGVIILEKRGFTFIQEVDPQRGGTNKDNTMKTKTLSEQVQNIIET